MVDSTGDIISIFTDFFPSVLFCLVLSALFKSLALSLILSFPIFNSASLFLTYVEFPSLDTYILKIVVSSS